MSSGSSAVLITGANGGLGQALLACFLERGWRVHGTLRCDPEKVGVSDRAGLTLHHCDLTDWSSIERVAAAVDEPLDIVINNAATFAGAAYRLSELDPAEMLKAFSTNVVGPTVVAKAFKGHLLRGTRRVLIMMSTGNASLLGNMSGEMLAYRASKSALNQVARTLSIEWRGDGLSAISLNPGWIRTRMGGQDAPLSPEEAADAVVAFALRPDVHRFSGAFVNTDGSEVPW